MNKFLSSTATSIKTFLVILILVLGVGKGWGQTTVFADNFSANQSATYTTSGTIASSSWSISRSGADFGGRRNTSPAQLELTNDVGATANVNGWVLASTNSSSFSTPYNTTLSSNTSVVTWNFNMRQIRADPAGFVSGSYGVAFILAGTSTTNNNTGSGYAVVLGQSGTTDAIRLVRYTSGIQGTMTNIITSNTTGLTDFGAEYLSVRVTYLPSTNTWELFLRNDGASAFTDPVSGSLTSQGTASDNTHTGIALAIMGAWWQGSTGANQTGFFNNVSVVISPTTYVWDGSTNNDFQVADNWTPTRTTPAVSDVLTFNNGTTLNITNVPTQDNGRINVISNTNLTLTAATAGNILEFTGNGGLGINITSGSTLAFDNTNYCDIVLGENATIAGTLNLSGELAVTTPKIITVSGAIGFNSASRITGTGDFVLSSGATLTTASVDGITSSGATGSVRVSGTRTFNTAANYTYNSSSAQSLGNAISTVNNLTASEASTKTMLGAVTVNGVLTLASSSKLAIGSNTLTLAGTVSGMNASNSLVGSTSSNLIVNSNLGSSVFFDATTDGSHINPSTGTNALNNLTLGASGNLILGNKLNLYNTLTVGTTSTLNSGEGLLVFRNTNTTTARLAAVSGTPTFTGAVVVETNINTQKRAWRLMTSPLTSAGSGGTVTGLITDNWQSNFAYGTQYQNVNYGTNFYSPTGGNGLDGTSVRNSLLRFNADTLTLGGYTNVNSLGAGNELFGSDAQSGTTPANKVYFAFIRGDKSVNATPGNPFVSTTLATKGRIQYGTKTYSFTGANSQTDGYVAIGNPYASPVDANALGYSGIAGNNSIFIWDANKNTVGGWETLTGFDAYATAGNITKNLQTGQAFLTKLDGATGSVEFQEADKITTFSATTTGAGNGMMDAFKTDLILVDNTTGNKQRIDGNKIFFGSGFNKNFIAAEDAEKLLNSEENISSLRNGKLIAVEARPFISSNDSIFFSFTNNKIANYEFSFIPTNFDATVTDARLVDKFLNTETPISLSANTTVAFNVTTATGSNAADRFMIVFRGTGSLPNRGFTVGAEKVGTSSVKVNWEAQAEVGVKNYELQHSADGVTFNSINTQDGKNGNLTNTYSYVDNNAVKGINYYRVKTTQLNDIERYSNIITINNLSNGLNVLNVFPNPVKGNTIGLQLQGLEKGDYTIRLFDNVGKEVYKKAINHNGNSSSQTITVNSKLAAGNYTLQLAGKTASYKQSVLVVE